ncbi:hypothetical protein [Halalkalibacter sp. APA_J-10(15)]|uniref:hypothetical protein n=1 Tax=unclassified Halalkalibacter TaxID=2893063 RepID=UPI001FF37736|nr:hypothetical protein [Halalkalibacter sp. APA_J-10(15)]MCK0471192.1 hypothetical protein [Halalkalibacter sp. APA_J-10(15)]
MTATIKKITMVGFMIFGMVMFLLLVIGLYLDISRFDETSGGYEPPYENYSGNPIDFSALDESNEGIVGRGYVMNFHLNCTTGMIGFELYGQQIDYRVVSERAIVVHQPREACMERGFSPEF